jgi:hypothetical protein
VTGDDQIMKKIRISKGWRLVFQGLPLVAAVLTTFLPLQRLGQQVSMLVVLLWLQVFLITEVFLAGS